MTGCSAEAVDAFTTDMRTHLEENQKVADQFRMNLDSSRFEQASEFINSAVKNQQEGAQVYALATLTQSETAMRALKAGAIHVDEGLEALIRTVNEKSPEVASAFKAAMAKFSGDVIKNIAGKGALNFNMHGTHIHIKQDFKNEDPDRIAIIFRRDLGAAATARVQARTTTPFGL